MTQKGSSSPAEFVDFDSLVDLEPSDGAGCELEELRRALVDAIQRLEWMIATDATRNQHVTAGLTTPRVAVDQPAPVSGSADKQHAAPASPSAELDAKEGEQSKDATP